MRLDIDGYNIMLAMCVSSRATCSRRQVGAIITDADGLILSTGYNGVPRGFDHCIDSPCEAATAPSGTNLEGCLAIHAEANALLHCHALPTAAIMYCTDSPCIHCVKLLLATPIYRIIYLREYPHDKAQAMWREADGEITRFEDQAQLRTIAHVSSQLQVAATVIGTELVEREDSVHRHGDKGSGVVREGTGFFKE